MAEQRFLHPHFLVPLDGVLWVLDEFQPVAALVEPATGEVLDLVDWRGLAAPPPGESTHVIGDGNQLWVQPGVHQDGVIGRVDAAGLHQVVDVGDTTLIAAGHGAAWCVDRRSPEPGEVTRTGGRTAPPPLREGRVVVVDATGRARTISVDGPVNFVEPRPDGLHVDLHTAPPDAELVGENPRTRSWTFHHHRARLRLPWTEPLPERIDSPRYEHHPRSAPSRWQWGGVGPWLSQHSTRNVTTRGLAAAGLRWALGPLRQQAQRPPHPVIATGHDPDDGTERSRLDLGVGRLEAAMECADLLWAVLCRAPRPRSGRPLELVRIDPKARQVDTVLRSGQVDITDRCWPLIPLPEKEITAHAHRERARYDDAERFLDDVSEVHCGLDGRWPDLGVRIRFRHPHFPGGWLTRRWPIFDELGRPVTLSYDGIYLMEHLACGHLPPVEAARDGVLEI